MYLMRSFGIIIICLCITIGKAYAHEGGHYHRNDGAALNTWLLKDGGAIRGNFSSGDDRSVVLEQYEGRTIRILLADLSDQDRELARMKIRKYRDRSLSAAPVIPLPQRADPVPYFLLVLALAGLALTAGYMMRSWRKFGYGWLLSYRPVLSGLCLVLLALACKKSSDDAGGSAIPKTSTTFIDAAFAPYKPAVSTRWDDNWFYVACNGLPAHNMMVGITSWQQQVPIPQPYTGSNSWSIPLQPVYAAAPLSTRTNLMKGAVAIAANGIPIFNALNNRGVDSYATGELDNWGGHCGRADDYHYHAAPLHLMATSGNNPIAFALDGFAVYGSKEPDGSAMQALDTCHGHVIGSGVYHYHGTTTYPYVVGAMRGKVNLDPNTPAPENQILPQAFASPVRPATSPLNGAVITDFISTGTNAYKLTYRQGSRFGYVEYNWDATNKYTYKLTDTAGVVTIQVYQR